MVSRETWWGFSPFFGPRNTALRSEQQLAAERHGAFVYQNRDLCIRTGIVGPARTPWHRRFARPSKRRAVLARPTGGANASEHPIADQQRGNDANLEIRRVGMGGIDHVVRALGENHRWNGQQDGVLCIQQASPTLRVPIIGKLVVWQNRSVRIV